MFQYLLYYIHLVSLISRCIAITETWLNNDLCDIYNIDGYQMVHGRDNQRGGGIAIYIKNNNEFRIRNDLNKLLRNNCECILIEVINTSKNNIIGVIYKPRDIPILSFTNDLSNCLEIIANENENKPS